MCLECDVKTTNYQTIVFLISAVCVYKGKQYNQGQKWQDGCAYDCECVDGNMGQFQCTDKYVVNYEKNKQSPLIEH